MGHDSTFTQVQGACRDIVLHVEEHIRMGTVCAVMVVLSGRRSWACAHTHVAVYQAVTCSQSSQLGEKRMFLEIRSWIPGQGTYLVLLQ